VNEIDATVGAAQACLRGERPTANSETPAHSWTCSFAGHPRRAHKKCLEHVLHRREPKNVYVCKSRMQTRLHYRVHFTKHCIYQAGLRVHFIRMEMHTRLHYRVQIQKN
jgi:hypothetical protein